MIEEKKSIVIRSAVVGTITLAFVLFLLSFSSPAEITENVTVVEVTESGCIAETSDGFSLNIGPCDAQPGDSVIATYDTKVKEILSAVIP